jgi:hypothetical protein
MEFKISTSKEREDYEILIRKRMDNDYASYCPQLNYMIKGEAHLEVQQKMEEYVNNYIAGLE